MEEPYVHKVLTGKVKRLGDPNAKHPIDGQWETSMLKTSNNEQLWLRKLALAGDEVADEKNDGGPEKAIFAYPIKHYTYLKENLQLDSADVGDLGENLAVLEMDEFTVCIGDIYQFGDAIIQVSQPRKPCWKQARRMGMLDFALQLQNSGRTGWYFRVLQEGYVLSKIDLELLERPYPQWTVAACNEIMHLYKDDLLLADELSSCTLLSKNWRKHLKNRLRGRESSIEQRIFGPNKL